MGGLARFIVEKPAWVFGLLALVIIVGFTGNRKLPHKHINPWALQSASGEAAGGASADLADSADSTEAASEAQSSE